MDFKKKRLNKALEDKTYRVKLVHGKKGWLAVGLTFITLFSASMFGQKVEASAVNNVAVANSAKSNYVQLWSDVTSSSIHKANRGLANGTAWKTAKAVKGYDGKTYILVGGNEYANANQMDLADETSKQDLSGVVLTNSQSRLYTNPLAANGPQLITNRGLGNNTAWKTDEKVVVNGQTYYRVATNEWIKSGNVTLTSESSRGTKDYTKNSPMAENADTNDNNNSGSTTTPSKPTESNKMVTVKITYFHRSTTGNDHYNLKTEVRQVKLGSKITIDAPEIDGYTVVSKENKQTYTVTFDGEEFSIPYTKNDGTDTENPANPNTDGKSKFVNVDLVDESGNIITKRWEQLYANKEVTLTAPSIDGYTPVKNEKSFFIGNDENQTITFEYKKGNSTIDSSVKTANVTVNYVDENGKKIADSKTIKRPVNEEFIITAAKTISNYQIYSDSASRIRVNAKGNVVTFVYKSSEDAKVVFPADATANLTIMYKSENGVRLAKDNVTTEKINTNVVSKAIDIPGYHLISEPEVTSFIYEGTGDSATFTYRKNDTTTNPEASKANITIKAVDENGKSIAEDTIIKDQEVSKDYTAQAPEIKGYVPSKKSEMVNVALKGSTVIFTYTKSAPVVEKANVTIKAKDTDDKSIAEDTIVKNQEVGKDYSAKAPVVEGYTADKATKTVNVSKDGSTITFIYTKDAVAPKTATVTTKFVDENDKEIAKSTTSKVKIGDSYPAKAIDVDGYSVKGDTTQNVTVEGDKTVTFHYVKQSSDSFDVNEAANKVIDAVNQYRISKGLKALKKDSILSAGANSRALDEVNAVNKNNDINAADHHLPDGSLFNEDENISKYPSFDLAENLEILGASDVDSFVAEALQGWKESPGHNENMLRASMTDTGVAVKKLNNGMYIVMQDFGGNGQSSVDWNADQYNTVAADSLGLTSDDLKKQFETSGLDTKSNYYISNYIFKTDSDVRDFLNMTGNDQEKYGNSIWNPSNTSGSFTSISVRDENGTFVGYAICLHNMNKPAQDYINQGLSTDI